MPTYTFNGSSGNDIIDKRFFSVGFFNNLSTLVINGGNGNDTLFSSNYIKKNILNGGAGDDVLICGSKQDKLDGGAGSDTASYFYSGSAVTVNLLTGIGSGGYAAGDTYSTIENITGSKAGDFLTGNTISNIIDGGDGNDTIEGGDGADKLIGGLATDTISYSSSNAGVTVDLNLSTATGGHANGDIISDFENVTGSAYDDNFTGTLYANTFNGLANTSTGGDTVSYLNSTAGVQINLNITGAQVSTGYGSGDILTNIENLTGSNWGDTLTGNSGANFLSGMNGADSIYGGAGNDTLRGGAGADYFNGGSGFDFVDYRDSGSTTSFWGVTVSLHSAAVISGYTAYGNDAQGDCGFTGIEGIYGSNFRDTLYGDSNDNIIYGFDGGDDIYGNAGNDIIYGGGISTTGPDELAGGDGNDTIYGGGSTNMFCGQTDAGNDVYYFAAGSATNHFYFDTVATVATTDIIFGYGNGATNIIDTGNLVTLANFTQCISGYGPGYDTHIVYGNETLILVGISSADWSSVILW